MLLPLKQQYINGPQGGGITLSFSLFKLIKYPFHISWTISFSLLTIKSLKMLVGIQMRDFREMLSYSYL